MEESSCPSSSASCPSSSSPFSSSPSTSSLPSSFSNTAYRNYEKRFKGKHVFSPSSSIPRHKQMEGILDLNLYPHLTSSLSSSSSPSPSSLFPIPIHFHNDWHPPSTSSSSSPSLLSPHAKLFSFPSIPGFYVIKNCFSPSSHLRMAYDCCYQYSRAKHNNLTNLKVMSEEEGNMMTLDGWNEDGDDDHFSRLRWISLGYHYDWTNREYRENLKSSFPLSLHSLAHSLSSSIDLSLTLNSEAAIVNFYPCHSSMGAHVDDAEVTHLPPIVSLSMGLSCVFMIGGKTRNDIPTGFFIDGGDAVVMSGEARMAFHSVPNVLEKTFHLEREEEIIRELTTTSSSPFPPLDDSKVRKLVRYLRSHRININIRQMEDHIHNFKSLKEMKTKENHNEKESKRGKEEEDETEGKNGEGGKGVNMMVMMMQQEEEKSNDDDRGSEKKQKMCDLTANSSSSQEKVLISSRKIGYHEAHPT